jgi:metal-responsive CopG/Arc/MetJ family transcriptional regulator
VATTIHVPSQLLRRIDVRAKALGVSRNRLILSALESTLVPTREWSPELVAMLLEPLDARSVAVFDATMKVVHRNRRNRRRAPVL